MAYTKLHSSIVGSSLWLEPMSTRILFITLIALADKDGMIFGSRKGLARMANIPETDVESAWDALLSPDDDSSDLVRSPEHQGRRVECVSGGFRLLNHAYYRNLRNDDDRRDQNREAQARFREKNARITASDIASTIEAFKTIWLEKFKIESSWHFDGAFKKHLPNLKPADLPNLVAAFDAHVAGLASTKLFNPEKFCATWRSYLPSTTTTEGAA